MPDLTPDQRLAALRRFAQRRTGMGVIKATLGPLTDVEREAFKRMQGIVELQAGANKAQPKLGSSDRHTTATAERSKVDRVPCADPARRKHLEADPVAWLRHYLAGTYSRPFEKPHREIVAGVMHAHDTHGRFVVAAERGIGKSAILWGMILFLALSGRQRYPVCVPWADKALKRAFRFWKNALCFNDRLGDDYPEFCAPFRHSRGVPQRVMTTTWRDTGGPTGAQLTVGEGIIVLPDRLGCLGGSTINGNIRGLNHPQDDGTVLRPSIVLLDDVQDRQTAKSPVQVADTVAIIDGDVAGCGDPGRDMPMLMACNCIAPEDVSEHYLSNPEWHALRVPCVEAWPDGWDDPKSACRELWDRWHERFQGGKGDMTFYRKNKKAMTAGMKLSAPAAFKGAEKCPDAFYGVMRMYFRMGHEAFMAERQQAPVDPVAASGPYVLNQDTILARVTKRPVFERPGWVTSVIASTDVNPSYALSTIVIGFGQDQTAAVLWYGIHPLAIPSDAPAGEHNRQLFAELTKHGRFLASIHGRPESWAIDGGGTNFDAVIRFAYESARLTGIPALSFTGRGAKNYRPYGKTLVPGQKREQCHGCFDVKDGRQIRWVAWNADYWREVWQRAWLGDGDLPGSVSLPAGQHYDFAMQVAGERLLGKGEIGGQLLWNWRTLPGKHDFGDAGAQAYAAAAFGGIGTGGRQATRKYVETRKCKVTREP